MSDRLLRGALWAGVVLVACGTAGGQEAAITLENPEAAGICGFRAMWDRPVLVAKEGATEVKDKRGAECGPTAVWAPSKLDGGAKPGAMAFDAVHRSLLVRFPAAAERIAEKINAGYAVAKAELVLPFRHAEYEPPGDVNFPSEEGGYHYRTNWGVGGLWAKKPPQWHAVAWALRRPWKADATLGPTYNAFINGAGYWGRFGAADANADRFPTRFGPTEVSHAHTTGRMDITPALTDEAYGKTPAERLRRLADCGFLLRKWELYDHRYFTGVYEWATGTGGRGIVINAPKLVVTFRPDPKAAPVKDLPPAADVAALAGELKRTGAGGKPTAVIPPDDELEALAERFKAARPDWMADWQWQRVQELALLGDGREHLTADAPFWQQYIPGFIRQRMKAKGTLTLRGSYERWVDAALARQPRGWYGFEGAEVLLPWFLYRPAMPEPMREHWRLYWTAWLMPDRPTSELVHPMKDQLERRQGTGGSVEDSYYARTGDWRGNKSFFRAGFNYVMSTMNFNHSASMGALLGGAIIHSPLAMADGRHGIEHWPLRTWSWLDGSTQESIDHYYFAITLSAQKMIADFGPSPFDRLIGRTILLKSMDELAGAYHPNLRRFIAGSARTATHHVLASQDGVYHILHTLSRRGVLHGLDDADLPGGMPVIGHEVSPLRVARQTYRGPWAPAWLADMVDDKPLPFEMTVAFTQWGGHKAHPLWRRTWLGDSYGLYSSDTGWGFLPNLAQWRRAARPVENMTERGTMLLRYGYNTTQLVNMAAGWIRHFGTEAALQHRNKMIVVTCPHRGIIQSLKDVRSLQATVALFNYEQPRPTWKIYVDEKPVDKLPFAAKAGQRIAIHDGVSYLGLVPLPAANLGRDAEVVLHEGQPQEFERMTFTPALVVDNYNLRREAPLDKSADWKAVGEAYGGFVVEMGDAKEYGDFASFRKHLAGATLKTRWQADANTFHVDYTSGSDRMEAGVITGYKEDRPTTELFAYRRVNGDWPYLPEGVFRRTSYAVQATTGRLEQGGAVLTCEPGRMAYLQALPKADIYAGYNPFPDPTAWRLDVPGGLRVEADGRLGLAHVVVMPKANRFQIFYALRDEQQAEAKIAKSLLVFGAKAPPAVELNGQAVTKPLEKVKHADGEAWRIPLLN